MGCLKCLAKLGFDTRFEALLEEKLIRSSNEVDGSVQVAMYKRRRCSGSRGLLAHYLLIALASLGDVVLEGDSGVTYQQWLAYGC